MVNTHKAEIFLYKQWIPKGLFQFQIIINAIALPAYFEYLCYYGSTATIIFLFFQCLDGV